MKKRNVIFFVSIMWMVSLLCGCAGAGKAELLTPSNKAGQETKVLSEKEGTEAEKGQEKVSDLIKEDGSLWSFSHRLLQENLEAVVRKHISLLVHLNQTIK